MLTILYRNDLLSFGIIALPILLVQLRIKEIDDLFRHQPGRDAGMVGSGALFKNRIWHLGENFIMQVVFKM